MPCPSGLGKPLNQLSLAQLQSVEKGFARDALEVFDLDRAASSGVSLPALLGRGELPLYQQNGAKRWAKTTRDPNNLAGKFGYAAGASDTV